MLFFNFYFSEARGIWKLDVCLGLGSTKKTSPSWKKPWHLYLFNQNCRMFSLLPKSRILLFIFCSFRNFFTHMTSVNAVTADWKWYSRHFCLLIGALSKQIQAMQIWQRIKCNLHSCFVVLHVFQRNLSFYFDIIESKRGLSAESLSKPPFNLILWLSSHRENALLSQSTRISALSSSKSWPCISIFKAEPGAY